MTTDMQRHLDRQAADEDVPQIFRDSPALMDLTNNVDGSPCFGVAVDYGAVYPLWVRVWVQPVERADRAEPTKSRFLVDISELGWLDDTRQQAVAATLGRRDVPVDFDKYWLQTVGAAQAIRSAMEIAARAQAVV